MLPRADAANLLTHLAATSGLYRGRGDGPETGPFLGRMQITPVVRGRVLTLDYEATSDRNGLQHLEHTIMVSGEGGRLELHVACLELPGVTRFVEIDHGVFRASDGTLTARIVLALPQPGTLSYAWWWSRDESEPREQSRCELRRTG